MITISAPNSDARSATGSAITLNSKYPLAKLDSTNPVSFQLITINFAHEPPNPDGTISTYQRTQIYQFAHGYTYTPSTWFLASTDGMSTAFGSEGVALVDNDTLDFAVSSALFVALVDETNVTFYIDKYYSAGHAVPNILGTVLTIRAYVFVNDLLGGDIPSHA